jgi:hypothetical protein
MTKNYSTFNYLSLLMFKNFQVIFIKFYLLRTFQKYKGNAQIPLQFSVLI